MFHRVPGHDEVVYIDEAGFPLLPSEYHLNEALICQRGVAQLERHSDELI